MLKTLYAHFLHLSEYIITQTCGYFLLVSHAGDLSDYLAQVVP